MRLFGLPATVRPDLRTDREAHPHAYGPGQGYIDRQPNYFRLAIRPKTTFSIFCTISSRRFVEMYFDKSKSSIVCVALRPCANKNIRQAPTFAVDIPLAGTVKTVYCFRWWNVFLQRFLSIYLSLASTVKTVYCFRWWNVFFSIKIYNTIKTYTNYDTFFEKYDFSRWGDLL